MDMLNWDDSNIDLGQKDDFITASNESMQDHNQEVRYCMLNDPDCEACQ